MTEMEHSYQQQNQDPRGTVMEHPYQQQNQDPRMRQQGGNFPSKRSELTHGEVESFSHGMTEMEHSYQQQNQDPRFREIENELHKTRLALEEKDKELKSFKDRVARDVTLSMKTGKRFESMNSPVSRSRLKEMYEELRMQWPTIKDALNSKERPESVKEMIQEKFKEAMVAMEKKKKQIDKVFGVNELSRGSASEKVQQYRLSTFQNLQLVLYHGRKEDADLKTPSSPHESEKPQDVMKSWSSKCYWLGCLMALNNPPLHPDWEKHKPGMDKWNFFPQNFTTASGK